MIGLTGLGAHRLSQARLVDIATRMSRLPEKKVSLNKRLPHLGNPLIL